MRTITPQHNLGDAVIVEYPSGTDAIHNGPATFIEYRDGHTIVRKTSNNLDITVPNAYVRAA